MRFIINMARREIRSSWKRLLFFFLCVGIGVGSIIALRSTIQNVNAAIAGEARQLLTADVQIDSSRPWTPESRVIVERLARPSLVEARTETIEASTMVRPADESRGGAMMVELKGIEPPFPLFGDFTLAGGGRFDHSLLDGNGAVVAQLLLDRLNLRVGNAVKIGTETFQIRGVIETEPGAGSGFRLGPRVFVKRDAVEAAGLTGFGSRARRKILLQTRAGRMESLVAELRRELKGQLVTVRSYKESQENLGAQFARAENYLSLTGLVILVLGGIGVSSVTRVFIEQKRKTIAILKCVGGTGAKITAAYLLQVLTLGLAGSLFGIVLAKLALLFMRSYFGETLPDNISYDLRPGAIAQGVGLGILISILFSALPLLRVRHIKPNLLLRGGETRLGLLRRFDLVWWATGFVVAVGLAVIASWQAGSLRVGLFFLGGLAAAAVALQLAAWLLIFVVRRTRNLSSFALKQAINSLHRPGNQTRVIVMAVGLGVFLVLAIQSLSTNLVADFDLARRDNLPNMFLIDVQTDQRGGVEQLVEEATGARPQLVPTVRARIYSINGREIDLERGEMREQRGMLGREYVVTYRPNLDPNETIVGGKFWDATPANEAEVSIEDGMRGLAGLDVGSTITFDVLGRKINARVTSVRRVDWRNSRTGFMVLFRPGVLERAPQTWIGAINAPTDANDRSRFQRTLLDRYPNVSMIDVAEIVSTVNRILSSVTLAVSFIGGFVFLSGVLILIGSIAMTKFQRV
ncbi:MAG TPA: ABC transporter permease, partial [Pyrinomonadaceae bacterium]|nr:ABC transporter permease [Pyrinomonadaceae bacterium]